MKVSTSIDENVVHTKVMGAGINRVTWIYATIHQRTHALHDSAGQSHIWDEPRGAACAVVTKHLAAAADRTDRAPGKYTVRDRWRRAVHAGVPHQKIP
jgi:hypothetical protein